MSETQIPDVDEKPVWTDKVIFDDKSVMRAYRFEGETCITFEHRGPRGGLLGRTVIPYYMLVGAAEAVQE